MGVEANAFDASVRAWVVAHQSPTLVTVFNWITVVGSVSPVIWVGVAGVILLVAQKKLYRAAALLVAPIGAVFAYSDLKRLFDRARPPGLHHVEDTYSFPSAHATTSAAVCGALFYILWREGLISGPVAITFVISVPLLVGLSRVYLDAHWATDVLGGWAIGAILAVASGHLYERTRKAGH